MEALVALSLWLRFYAQPVPEQFTIIRPVYVEQQATSATYADIAGPQGNVFKSGAVDSQSGGSAQSPAQPAVVVPQQGENCWSYTSCKNLEYGSDYNNAQSGNEKGATP